MTQKRKPGRPRTPKEAKRTIITISSPPDLTKKIRKASGALPMGTWCKQKLYDIFS